MLFCYWHIFCKQQVAGFSFFIPDSLCCLTGKFNSYEYDLFKITSTISTIYFWFSVYNAFSFYSFAYLNCFCWIDNFSNSLTFTSANLETIDYILPMP